MMEHQNMQAAPPAVEREDAEAMLSAEEKAGLRTALIIYGTLLIVAIILGLTLFGWPVGLPVALGIFLYLSLFGSPFWLAAIEDQAEEEHERITHEVRSIH